MLKVTTTAAACAAVAVMVSASMLTACTSTGSQVATVRGGAVNLKQVRVGTPETIFKEAVVTFVPDPAGAVAGKTQYLSRLEDNDGSQYVAQVKNDECYSVELMNREKQLSREAAIAKMQSLLPESVVAAGAPVVKTQAKSEVFVWNKKFSGEVQYTDSSRKNVWMVSASRLGVF